MRDAAGPTTLDTFQRYAAAGFAEAILPIIPPDAPISSVSKLPPENRGKVPGKKTSKGWVGLKDWTAHVSTASDLTRYNSWGAGLGLNCHSLGAFDIDVLDADLADAIERAVLEYAADIFPEPPVRYGNAPKRLILTRIINGLKLGKRRLAFRLPGEDPSEKPRHAVEFLSSGQQFVAEGVHPKTKKPYTWKNGISPADIGVGNLVPMCERSVNRLWDTIGMLADLYGGEAAESGAQGAAHGPGARKGMGDASKLAPTPQHAVDALRLIPVDSLPTYSDVLPVILAYKAAVGGNEDYYSALEEWALEYGDNSPDWVRARWNSADETDVGWHRLEEEASKHGYQRDAADDFADDTPGEVGAGAGRARSAGVGGDDFADDTPNPEDMDALFQNWGYVNDLSRFIRLTDRQMFTAEQFSTLHAHIGQFWKAETRASTQWLRNTTARAATFADRATYRPGKPLFVREADGRKALNLWRPSTVAPASEVSDGDVGIWLTHMQKMIPDAHQLDTVLDWMGTVLRGEKPNWAVLVGGGQGIGKDVGFLPFVHALGMHNTKVIGPDDLRGGYTDWAANAQLVLIEEMKNYEKNEVSNRLKSYITCPPEEVRVNAKYVPQYQVPNTAAYLFFTNHKDALSLENDDRRFFVVWSDMIPEPDEYYDALGPWVRDPVNVAKVAGWLLARKGGVVKLPNRAPSTKAKNAMRLESMGDLARTLHDRIEEGAFPYSPDILFPSVLAAHMHGRGEEKHLSLDSLTRKLTHALRALGYTPAPGEDGIHMHPSKPLPLSGALRGRPWIVRRREIYQKLNSQEMLAAFWGQWQRSEVLPIRSAEEWS